MNNFKITTKWLNDEISHRYLDSSDWVKTAVRAMQFYQFDELHRENWTHLIRQGTYLELLPTPLRNIEY